ncbi:18289_t:CDS:1, partial [Acaulospora morrowiae]
MAPNLPITSTILPARKSLSSQPLIRQPSPAAYLLIDNGDEEISCETFNVLEKKQSELSNLETQDHKEVIAQFDPFAKPPERNNRR